MLVVVVVNLSFWILVAAGFSPVQRQYEHGKVLWIGSQAYVFAHGFWTFSNGYLEHQTRVRLADGTPYLGSTFDLLAHLRRKGARSVWWTWCYSGDFPYIRKDLITGKETPWPSYTSYNRLPGRTVPIWLGPSFIRLGLPRQDSLAVPRLVDVLSSDTLYLEWQTPTSFERAFHRFRYEIPWLPQIDSFHGRIPRRLRRQETNSLT